MIISQVQQPFKVFLEPQQREELKAEDAKMLYEKEKEEEIKAAVTPAAQVGERESLQGRLLENSNLGRNLDITV